MWGWGPQEVQQPHPCGCAGFGPIQLPQFGVLWLQLSQADVACGSCIVMSCLFCFQAFLGLVLFWPNRGSLCIVPHRNQASAWSPRLSLKSWWKLLWPLSSCLLHTCRSNTRCTSVPAPCSLQCHCVTCTWTMPRVAVECFSRKQGAESWGVHELWTHGECPSFPEINSAFLASRPIVGGIALKISLIPWCLFPLPWWLSLASLLSMLLSLAGNG